MQWILVLVLDVGAETSANARVLQDDEGFDLPDPDAEEAARMDVFRHGRASSDQWVEVTLPTKLSEFAQ